MKDVVELRRYTLHPGQRDVLIDVFDRELVETQEAEGMRVLGQFRDLDDPDEFVWVRSFPDMPTRAAALTAFYTGPAWKANRATANATMIAVDNVLLLRPVGQGFTVDAAVRDTPATSLVVATVYYLAAPPSDELVRFFNDTMIPLIAKNGGTPLSLLQTEYADNNYPQLPVRTNDHVLTLFASYAAEDDYDSHLAELREWPTIPTTIERLRLAPTNRSLLR